jgi:hypothetical protein
MNTCDSIHEDGFELLRVCRRLSRSNARGGMFMDDGQKSTKSGSKALYMAF